MMKPARLPLTLLLLLAPLSVALAEVRPGAVTLSPVVGVYGFEGKQDLETKAVYGIRLGYDIVPYFGVEAVGDWVSTVSDNFRPENHVDVFRYGLDGLIYLAPDWRLVPYLAIGGGGITIKDPGSPWDKSQGYFNYGLGVKVSLWAAVALRADVRHILFSDVQTNNNYEGTLGLAFVFGGQKPAAAAPKAGEGLQAWPPPSAEAAAPPPPPKPALEPVAVPAPPPPAAPIGGISANPESVDKGQCSTLTWSVANAARASIEPGIGSVATSGSRQVCPEATMRYTITATGGGGSGTASTTVTVKPPPLPPAPAVSLSATPASVDKGKCSMLTWSASNAATVAIEPGIGSVAPSGSIPVCLDDTQRYTATATGEGGSGTASTTVSVNPPQKISLKIEFATGKWDIPPKSIPDIAWVADFLKKNPGAKAVIEGHTDDVGKPGANKKLSLARAESVKKYLMKNFGIEGSRLSTAGYGSSRPIADNATPDGKRQNRRVEAIFR